MSLALSILAFTFKKESMQSGVEQILPVRPTTFTLHRRNEKTGTEYICCSGTAGPIVYAEIGLVLGSAVQTEDCSFHTMVDSLL